MVDSELLKRIAEIKKLPPDKRIKALKELEEELKKLEEERYQGIEEAMVLEQKAEEEIAKIKEILPKDTPKDIGEMFKKEELEQKVEDAPEQQPQGPIYSAPFEEVKKIYEMTGDDKFNEIKQLKEKSYRGDLTPDDWNKMEYMRSEMESFTPKLEYVGDDARDKFLREEQMLSDIEKYNRAGK